MTPLGDQAVLFKIHMQYVGNGGLSTVLHGSFLAGWPSHYPASYYNNEFCARTDGKFMGAKQRSRWLVAALKCVQKFTDDLIGEKKSFGRQMPATCIKVGISCLLTLF